MRLGGVLSAAAEVFLPGLCPHCGEVLEGNDRGLCRRCWSSLIPQFGVSCQRCGVPAADGDTVCISCTSAPPPQQATIAWGEHAGALRTAILAIKQAGRDDLAGPLAARLAAAVAGCSWAVDVETVCWVPSHALRRIRRPWPAAALLASEVARWLGRPVVRCLRRHGFTRQTGRSRVQRLTLSPRSYSATPAVRDRAVLLVDDVSTTGATLRRASEALLRGGAKRVYCAVLARTVDPRRRT